MTDPKPMDLKRLAELRIKVAGMVEYCAAQTEGGTDQWTPVAELLDDRDHQEAEAAAMGREVKAIRELRADMERRMMLAQSETRRYRSRCPVTAEDVEAAGVTWTLFDAWVEGQGFSAARRPAPWDRPKLKLQGRSDIGWVRGDTFYGYSAAWPENRRAYGLVGEVASFIAFASKALKCPASDILDEMAKAAAQ